MITRFRRHLWFRPHFGAHLILPLVAALICGLPLAGAAAAQEADFLFERPRVTLGVKLGYAFPSAESEVFDFTREQLTVEKSDFNAFSFGGEAGYRLTERIDIALDLGYERSDAGSEFREFVGTDDLPIRQNTKFTRVPVSIGAKLYPWARGRSVSRFAWVPRRWSPYLGAGAGLVWYRFEQVGEFVDFETLEIFLDEFESRGTSPLAYAAAGLEYSLGPRWLASAEARYRWASAEMGRDFVDFDDIDLSGFRATLGLSVRF